MAVNYTEFKEAYDKQNLQEWFGQQTDEAVQGMVGGWSRLKVLVLLASVLALDSADKATVGAIAVPLKHSLHINNLDIGLLVAASTAIGALATLPLGILADRTHRVKLLTVCILLWSAAMAVSGFTNSFASLLITRLALGAVVAAVTPIMASLTGDYFRPGVRGRIWGYILSGELIGAGFGILIAGEIAAVASWHFSFWTLSMVGFLLALAIWKWLPEPRRGSQLFLPKDKEKIPTEEELQDFERNEEANEVDVDEDIVEEEIEEQNIDSRDEQTLEESANNMSFWQAARYILSIRTNVLLIIASACGYFFFTGLRTFIMVYTQGQFNLDQATSQFVIVLVGLGAIIGVLITGRTADKLIERGHLSARITVGGFAYLITAAAFLAAFFSKSLLVAMPLFFIGAASLGGVNAPIDAARLDIMNAHLWGRAESIRTTFRFTFEALAPIIFGWVSMQLGGKGGFLGDGGSGSSSALALAHTFEIMLIPVIIAIIVLYFARKTYPRDVATVLASDEGD
jgi:predicted MFS family arabinose efflux permease